MRKMKIGDCMVDYGQVLIIDPGHIPDDIDGFYEECCRVAGGTIRAGVVNKGLATITQSGLGDGNYPIYAIYEDLGDAGERIAKIEIDFMGDEEQEKWTRMTVLDGLFNESKLGDPRPDDYELFTTVIDIMEDLPEDEFKAYKKGEFKEIKEDLYKAFLKGDNKRNKAIIDSAVGIFK